MGSVSYLEDIKDRLASELAALEKSLEPGIHQHASTDVEAVRKWIATAHSLLRRLQAKIELATDPSIDLVERIAETDGANDVLRAELTSLKTGYAQQLQVARREESLKYELIVRQLRALASHASLPILPAASGALEPAELAKRSADEGSSVMTSASGWSQSPG